jgi:hypothetical protein
VAQQQPAGKQTQGAGAGRIVVSTTRCDFNAGSTTQSGSAGNSVLHGHSGTPLTTSALLSSGRTILPAASHLSKFGLETSE